MKIKKSLVITIAIVVAVLAAAAVLFKTKGDIFRFARYDPAMETSRKLAMIEGWLPENADFTVVADVHRLAAMPELKGFLEEGLFKGDDTAIKTIRSLLGPQAKIGMIAMSAILGDTGIPISFFVIVQGDFKEINFVESIKKELASESVTLVSKPVGAVSLYSQEGDQALFAFSVPDRNHLIVGTKDSMEQLLLQKPVKEKALPFVSIDSPFFGYLKSSERIKKILPPQFQSLALAKFWADDQRLLHLSIECADTEQAGGLKMFLLGMKALYMLQGEANKPLVDALGTVLIGGEENVVRVDVPLQNIPAIFPMKN